jgi:hypothetical protein
VSLRAVRLIPRSKSLIDRGLSLAASASSSWVSPLSVRSRRSAPQSYPQAAPPSPCALRGRVRSLEEGVRLPASGEPATVSERMVTQVLIVRNVTFQDLFRMSP